MFGFLTFSGGIGMVHWTKVGWIKKLKVTLENMDEINLKIQDI